LITPFIVVEKPMYMPPDKRQALFRQILSEPKANLEDITQHFRNEHNDMFFAQTLVDAGCVEEAIRVCQVLGQGANLQLARELHDEYH